MSLSPQEPRLWWGVMFVRKGCRAQIKCQVFNNRVADVHKGPYASAVLKFTVLFPTSYPANPPIITFLSDIYHPLIVPPTPPPTNAPLPAQSSPGKSQPSAAHYNHNQNVLYLPPGSFTLSHGFPSWHSAPSPKSTISLGGKKLPPQPPQESPDHISLSLVSSSSEKEKNILQVLYYIKSVFSSVSVLDDIPPHLATNLGAWRAWRSFREADPVGSNNDGKNVWMEKVNSCISGTQTEGVLYGGMGLGRGGGGLGNEEMVFFFPPPSIPSMICPFFFKLQVLPLTIACDC